MAGGLYRRHCQHCHGASGDGDGPTSTLIFPRPRLSQGPLQIYVHASRQEADPRRPGSDDPAREETGRLSSGKRSSTGSSSRARGWGISTRRRRSSGSTARRVGAADPDVRPQFGAVQGGSASDRSLLADRQWNRWRQDAGALYVILTPESIWDLVNFVLRCPPSRPYSPTPPGREDRLLSLAPQSFRRARTVVPRRGRSRTADHARDGR